MRAPGEASGTFALESAMDELALRLKIDPIELRLRNYAETDPHEDKPFSSKSLRECYAARRRSASAGRSRTPQPRSMRDGDVLIGWGMATATYPAQPQRTSARARDLRPRRRGRSCKPATQDLGTGTYTVMTQVAADALGLPIERVRFELGDSRFPKAPVSGGSQTAASVGAGGAGRGRGRAATSCSRWRSPSSRSPLAGAAPTDLALDDGFVRRRARRRTRVSDRGAARPQRLDRLEARGNAKRRATRKSSTRCTPSARSSPRCASTRLPARSASAAVSAPLLPGRILNAKTARSQLMGGIVWGIGMALLEETLSTPTSAASRTPTSPNISCR